MKVDQSIFREYDIRGVAGDEFDPRLVEEFEKFYGKFKGVSLTVDVARAVGKAYGTIIHGDGGKKVAIGYENRPFAIELTNALIEGVLSTGIDVVFLGTSLTPLVYFTVAHYNLDGGINVTGSHNIYFYNGFKLMKKNNLPLYGEEMSKLRQMVIDDNYYSSPTLGKKEELRPFDEYKKYLKNNFSDLSGMKVVIDSGNGSAGIYGPELFEELGAEVVELFSDLDPKFPNHVPDPEMQQNMKFLMDKVREVKADIGIGFDADGDRSGFVDERGEFIDADLTLMLMAKQVLTKHPGKKILFDVKCTELLNTKILEYGGVPLMHKTGHAPIKATLRSDLDVVLAGEISGHFYFVDDYYKIDDGVYAAVYLADLLKKSGRKLSELIAEYPERIRTPEIKLPIDDVSKKETVDKITESLKSKFRSVLIDGIRFYTSDTAWGLLRPSNTSPYLTVRFEAETKEEVMNLKKILDDELAKYPAIQDRLDLDNVASMTGKLGWR